MSRLLTTFLLIVTLLVFASPANSQEPPAWQDYFEQETRRLSLVSAERMNAVTLDNWAKTQETWRNELQDTLNSN